MTSLTDIKGIRLHNVAVSAVQHDGRDGLLVTEPPGTDDHREDKLAVLPDLLFRDGTIVVDVAGRPAAGAQEAARGFVGVAFRVAPGVEAFECFYIRPTNGRADDQLRRNHSTQYISFPGHPWHKLREETPGKYESYADMAPGEWTSLRIAVEGERSRLYVGGAEQPALIVNDLKLGASEGAIGLWIGPGTEGFFADLRVTR